VTLAAVCEKLGAGEILLNSIDRDGTKSGFDLDTIRAVKAAVSIPVIASAAPARWSTSPRFAETDVEVASPLGSSIGGSRSRRSRRTGRRATRQVPGGRERIPSPDSEVFFLRAPHPRMSIAPAIEKNGEPASPRHADVLRHPVPPRCTRQKVAHRRRVPPTGWVDENILDDACLARRAGSHEQISLLPRLWNDLHKKYSFVNDQIDEKEAGPFGNLDSTFLVAGRAGIFYVGPDMSVTKVKHYFAIGSGAQFARRAHALHGTRAPRRRAPRGRGRDRLRHLLRRRGADLPGRRAEGLTAGAPPTYRIPLAAERRAMFCSHNDHKR
jgi:hypothetical protein